jgi:hypothetical protein
MKYNIIETTTDETSIASQSLVNLKHSRYNEENIMDVLEINKQIRKMYQEEEEKIEMQ